MSAPKKRQQAKSPGKKRGATIKHTHALRPFGIKTNSFELPVRAALLALDAGIVSGRSPNDSLDTGQFMPKIADIIRMLQGSSQDSALTAWSKVDKAVRQIGPYRSVVFDDALIHVVLHEMGGWSGLSRKTDDEWPFVAREFENRYRGFKSRGDIPAYPPKLLGISDSHNAQSEKTMGFIQPPMLIGDAAKAEQVMRGGTDRPLLGMTKLNVESHILQLAEKRAA